MSFFEHISKKTRIIFFNLNDLKHLKIYMVPEIQGGQMFRTWTFRPRTFWPRTFLTGLFSGVDVLERFFYKKIFLCSVSQKNEW